MAAQRKNLLGQTLVDRYELCGLIGTGAMGSVYQARDHQRSGGPCAVKVLHLGVHLEQDSYQRFVNEAGIAAQLFHPHIVEAHEFRETTDGTPFIVMELLQGEDLHCLLSRVKQLSWQRTLNIVRQVGSALHAAHSIGIIHRDVKPKNVFVCRTEQPGAPETIKVVDFGLSKILDRGEQFTTVGLIMGTPEYLSPEATCGDTSQIDARSDEWALGVMAYRMLAGHLPFESPDFVEILMKIRHESPPPLRQVAPPMPECFLAAIERAIAKRKEDRFPSVLEFVRACSGASACDEIIPIRSLPSAPQSVQTKAAPPNGSAVGTGPPITPAAPLQPEPPPPLARGRLEVRRARDSRWLVLGGPLLGAAGLAFLHLQWSAARGAREGANAPPALLSPAAPAARTAPPLLTPASPLPPPEEALVPLPAPVPPEGPPPLPLKTRSGPARGPSGLSGPSQQNAAPAAARLASRRLTAALPAFSTSHVIPPVAAGVARLPTLVLDPVLTQGAAADRDEPQYLASPLPHLSGRDPHLPTNVKLLNRGRQIEGLYELCVGPDGHVKTVKVLRAIPFADEELMSALHTWVFPPAARSRCFSKELVFAVE